MKKIVKKRVIVLISYVLMLGVTSQITMNTNKAFGIPIANAAEIVTPVPGMTEAKVLDASGIQVYWNSNGYFQGVYLVYRKEEGKDFSILGGLKVKGEGVQEFVDKTVLPGVKYTYMVTAVPEHGLERVGIGGEVSSNENYIEQTYEWENPKKGVAKQILIFADNDLMDIKSPSEKSVTYQYPYNVETPDLDIYALLDGIETTPSSNVVSAMTTLEPVQVKKACLVAPKKARIEWTKSEGATGYMIYRRSSMSQSWKRVEIVVGDNQLFGYDETVAQKQYYYVIRPFVMVDKKMAFQPLDEVGTKVVFKKKNLKKIKGDYKPGSVYGSALTKKQLSQVKSSVRKFCDKYISSDMNTVEKLLAAQLYLMKKCTYANNGAKFGVHTAWGALVYKNSKGLHEAQCSGYSKGFKALCDGMGIKCRYVHANEKSANPNHQWNEVKIRKKWYLIDPQCNAQSGFLAFFLCSGKTYAGISGMKWNKSAYPALSNTDYSSGKIREAYEGYKIQKIYHKLFKK